MTLTEHYDAMHAFEAATQADMEAFLGRIALLIIEALGDLRAADRWADDGGRLSE